jgi:hypothetical protein
VSDPSDDATYRDTLPLAIPPGAEPSNPMIYEGDDSEMERLLSKHNALDPTRPPEELLDGEVPLAIQVLHNDFTHPDYKARQSAATKILEIAPKTAALAAKRNAAPQVVVQLNLDHVAQGLRQVAEIGLGGPTSPPEGEENGTQD